MKTYSIRLSPVLTDLYKLESWLLELPIPENTDTKVLALVAEEAFSNIVLHGFEDRPANSDGYVDIEMGFMDNGLTMRFVDNGKEYSLNQIPVPDLHANLQERQIGGLGWHLIRHYMTQIVYKRIKDNNVLYLFKEKQGEHYASNTE